MTATFDTSDYKRSHGRNPRGNGMWAFAPDSTDDWLFSPAMTYAEAKKWAREQAPDATVFVVGP